MASRRKTFTPKGPAPTDPHQYAAFAADVLLNNISAQATKLIESRDGNGKLVLEYDDPNG
jgi:hypothetical protein